MSIEAMKQALEILESAIDQLAKPYSTQAQYAITPLFQAIAKAEKQEPVAWYRDEDGIRIYYETKVWDDCTPLYTTPQQRTWVGLTDEEIDQGLLRSNYALQTASAWRDGVEWATKQLMERNT